MPVRTVNVVRSRRIATCHSPQNRAQVSRQATLHRLCWSLRQPDPYITSGSFDISAWVGGNETTQQYFVPQGANTYHATQTTTKVYDIATGDTFIAVTTLRLPDFDCPASDEDGCSFS